MAKRKLEVIIAGDASGLNRALGQVDKFGSSLGGKLKTVGKTAGVGLAAGLGLAAKVGFDAITEAAEAAKIGRLTDAVLKSTGGAANVTADEVAGLAEQISNLTGVDDEQIQSGQNLLLTFTKVRNEVGKGNDIFNQATQASVDMAAALGTDVSKASMQLGKALNDPIKGVTALSRAGVSFTQQQKDQINAMVESGDVLGAQKIILGEMQTQFGGAARAASDPMQRLRTIVGNLQERIGTALLPAVEAASVWLGRNLPRALDFAQRTFQKVRAWIQTNWPKVRDVIIEVVAKISGYVRPVLAALQQAWAVFGDNVLRQVSLAFNMIRSVFGSVLQVIQGLFRIFAGVFTGDWGRAWDGVKDIFSGVWNAIVGVFQYAWGTLRNYAGAAVDGIVLLFSGIGSRIGSALSSLGSTITAPFRAAWNALANLWNAGPGSFSFSIPSWVPGLGGNTFDVPNLPTLNFHTGGIVPGRGDIPAMLLGGEGVIRPSTVQALSQDLFKTRPAMSGARASAGSTVVVQLHVHGNLIHQNDLDRHLADVITQSFRRGGALGHSIRRVAQGAA